jgi:hypothetical protein
MAYRSRFNGVCRICVVGNNQNFTIPLRSANSLSAATADAGFAGYEDITDDLASRRVIRSGDDFQLLMIYVAESSSRRAYSWSAKVPIKISEP